MPTKSRAFARIRAAHLALVREIPTGRVAEVGAVAIALNIPPRHVAYILSQLSEDERAVVPWHRVVPKDGKFPANAKRTASHDEQILALAREGVDAEGRDVLALSWLLSDEHCNTFWADED